MKKWSVFFGLFESNAFVIITAYGDLLDMQDMIRNAIIAKGTGILR